MTEGNAASSQPETVIDRFINSAGSLVRGENMTETTCDRKGRIYLEESIRAKYGEKFIAVEAPGELVLLPVPDDLVKDLEEIGRSLRGLSVEDLKRRTDEQAQREVGM